jgi:hypothetical protein
MTAAFGVAGPNETEIVLDPDNAVERLLLAAFLRHDSNVLHIQVERSTDGLLIRTVRLRAEQSS